jgi:glycosylphosphatidylinositol transamidase (GPIT) subunit GPI8
MSIDYKEQDNHNYQVLDILRGRQMNLMNSFRQLNSDKNSRIVVIITSHGGENFIKVREKLVILSDELHRTLNEMYIKDKYKEMLFILDTCEGFSLFDNVKVPNVYFVASALLDQKASSYSFDTNIMGPTADKFHYLLWKELNRINKEKAFDMLVNDLMKDLAKQKEFLTTDVTIRNEIQRNLTIGEFFGDTRWGDHVMEEVLQFVNVDEFDKANEVKNTLGVNSVLLESKREKEVEVLNVRKYTRDVYEMERKENGMGRRIIAGMLVGGIAMVVVGSLVL